MSIERDRAWPTSIAIARLKPTSEWTAISVLVLSAWFGLAAGLLELALLVARVEAFEKGFFLRSPHFLWMVPLSDLAIAACWGAVLALTARAGWSIAPRWALAGFLFLACASQFLLVPGINSAACALLSAGVAWRASAWLEPRAPRVLQWARRGLPVLLTALLVLAGAAQARDWSLRRAVFPATPRMAGQAPNVLLIVLDTVRADRLSVYGYDRDTTPNLKRLAARGVRFDQARSAAPWTLPSHASMFTGLWPHEVRVERRVRLGPGPLTLAEHFAARGYATAGFVANHYLCGHESGLSRGFEVYRDYPVTPFEVFRSSSLGWYLTRRYERLRDEWQWLTARHGPESLSLDFPRKPAASINRELLDWLGAGRKRPFFAFLNYFDAHDPYVPPLRPARSLAGPPRSRADVLFLRDWPKLDKASLPPEAIALASHAYDDCIAALDLEIGRLLDDLEHRKLLDNTLIVLTADHGEQFGEHGAFGHAMSVYGPEVHVPLLMAFPGRIPAGRVVKTPVGLRDLPATIVDLVGTPEGPAPFPGSSFARAWGARPSPGGPPMSELESPIAAVTLTPAQLRGFSPLKAVVEGNTVYIHHEDGNEELYDLDRDPAESENLEKSEQYQGALDRCRRSLEAILQQGSNATR